MLNDFVMEHWEWLVSMATTSVRLGYFKINSIWFISFLICKIETQVICQIEACIEPYMIGRLYHRLLSGYGLFIGQPGDWSPGDGRLISSMFDISPLTGRLATAVARQPVGIGQSALVSIV